MRLGVVVLAGGRSERLGEAKLLAEVARRPLLDHTLDSLPPHASVVCVGPPVPAARSVTWVREDPPYAGPLAAIACGARALPRDVRAVALVGGDMPRAGRVVPSLQFALAAASASQHSGNRPGQAGVPLEAAVAVSSDGHRQPLLAVWWRDRLLRRLEVLRDLADRPARALLASTPVVELEVPPSAISDVDTAHDLQRLRVREATADDGERRS